MHIYSPVITYYFPIQKRDNKNENMTVASTTVCLVQAIALKGNLSFLSR